MDLTKGSNLLPDDAPGVRNTGFAKQLCKGLFDHAARVFPEWRRQCRC